MILLWRQLELHYGDEIKYHRSHFETGGRKTYGLLCCRFSPLDDFLAFSDGEHAEERLLKSQEWKTGIPRALANWTPESSPIIVTIAVNRSPCRTCAPLLMAELQGLQRRFPVACENARFILACRGLYAGQEYILGTRKNAFPQLKEVGWEQCVLQMGSELPNSGRELLREIEEAVGKGLVRLG